MTDLVYGHRRIVFEQSGLVALCGTSGDSAGSHHALGRYRDETDGTRLWMLDNPAGTFGFHHLVPLGLAGNRAAAKTILLEACQANARHGLSTDEYVDSTGRVRRPEPAKKPSAKKSLPAEANAALGHPTERQDTPSQ